MKLEEIRQMPTTVGVYHESCFRSFHVLQKIMELVAAGTPAAVIAEIYGDLTDAPAITIHEPEGQS